MNIDGFVMPTLATPVLLPMSEIAVARAADPTSSRAGVVFLQSIVAWLTGYL